MVTFSASTTAKYNNLHKTKENAILFFRHGVPVFLNEDSEQELIEEIETLPKEQEFSLSAPTGKEDETISELTWKAKILILMIGVTLFDYFLGPIQGQTNGMMMLWFIIIFFYVNGEYISKAQNDE